MTDVTSLRVLADAVAVLMRRLLNRLGRTGRRAPLPSWNTMFRRELVHHLQKEKREIESFDMFLFTRLNSPRLEGQLVFEYGMLANYVKSWKRMAVLDVGAGGSSFPDWMASEGAFVVAFDYPGMSRRMLNLG